MKEQSFTTYTCEICHFPWSSKEFCERCEAIGYPENYNKLLGKWIVVPTSVYFSKKASETSFDFVPEKLWRVVRIDSNYIVNLSTGMVAPTGVTSDNSADVEKQYADQMLSLHHRLVVTCKGFEDNSRVESLKQFFDIPEELYESLNQRLVDMERDRLKDKEEAQKSFVAEMTRYVSQFFTSNEFEARQHELAEKALRDVLALTNIQLPDIEKEEMPSITIQAN